jgi:hypothetical protein
MEIKYKFKLTTSKIIFPNANDILPLAFLPPAHLVPMRMRHPHLPRLATPQLTLRVEIQVLLSAKTDHQGYWTSQRKDLSGMLYFDGNVLSIVA